MTFTLFFPLVTFVMELIVCALWGASALYLASMGESSFAASNETVYNETINGETRVKNDIEKVIKEIPCDPNVSGILHRVGGDGKSCVRTLRCL